MKKYRVTIKYEYEGYNGYEHTRRVNYTIEARNIKSVTNKAGKQFNKEHSYLACNFEIEKIVEV